MTAYRRSDDGAEMVETKPGCVVRRDVALRLGLVAPEIGFGAHRPARTAVVPLPSPDALVPPPLQPSHQDLSVALAADPVPRVDALMVEPATVVVRVSRPRPAKRDLAVILAESARRHRALRPRVKA